MTRVAPPRFWLALVLLLLGSAMAACAGDDTTEAWRLIARHLGGDAAALLAKSPRNVDRETTLAVAVVLMDAEPITESHARQAMARFEDLSRGDDDVALAAAYLLARAYQQRITPANYPEAARRYQALAARRPESYWAQLGLVKLAMLRLLALPEPANPAARVAAAEELLPRVTIPALQRDLHIVIGRGALFHGQPLDRVLGHLVAADRLGELSGPPRVEFMLQLGELSRRAGRWEQARFYFQKFLDENEADGRAYTVKMRLAQIAPHLAASEAKP